MSDQKIPLQDSPNIGHVSDTALWVAVYRDQESKRPDALFKDPYAGILAGEKGVKIVENLGMRGRNTSFAIVVRTAVLDEMILHTIKDQNIDTVLNLAAGLDTRPYRMELAPTLRWIEVDFPAIIQYKIEKLKEFKPICRLERIVQDLADERGRRALFERINSESKNILVITEGLLLYLDEKVVRGLAQDLAAQSHMRSWIFDYATMFLLKFLNRGVKDKLKNAPFIFGVDPELKFFQDLGWRVAEKRLTMVEAARLNRFPTQNILQKIFFLFTSAKTRERFRTMSGYARLIP